MQCIKETSLRYSKKGNKPIPKVVFRFGSHNRMVKKALETRRFILDSLKQLKKESVKESDKELTAISEVR
jgi:ferritin